MASTFRPKHLLPNAITATSVVLGFLCILSAADGHHERGVMLLFFAGVCDLLDGRLARWLDAGTAFGGELDTLSDAVSFGVAPVVLVYFADLRPLGLAGILGCIVYLLAGVFRLARFNLDKIKRPTFFGLPIPLGAAYMVTFVMLRDQVSPWWILGGVLATAAAMISTVKVPNFKDRERTLPWPLIPLMFLFFGVFLWRPNAWTWHAWDALNWILVAANYRMLSRRARLLPVADGGTEERAA
ncbi:MAG: CDP-diacylglycerol--serine O-phosphatidyltransferase [Myxococcales bacterium]|nr:CDP-diacylglycerol--serine O-phosphatidyltransferase [Myxococcales bacterium]